MVQKIKKMQSTQKRLIRIPALIIIAAAVLSGAILSCLLYSLRPFTALMLNLSASDVLAYSKLLPKGTCIVSKNLAEKKEAWPAFKTVDCIFGVDGATFRAISGKALSIDKSILLRLPPSLRSMVRINEQEYSALPLQLDHFELAWDKEKFAAKRLEDPILMVNFKKAIEAHHHPVEPALLFAGSDDETLLSLVSVLCVSETGADGYKKAVESLMSSDDPAKIIDTCLATDSQGKDVTIRSICAHIASWSASGYLHPEWFNLKESDVRDYMEKGFGFMVFGSITFHRSVGYQAIYKYGSSPFPVANSSGSRTIVAPVTAVSFANGKRYSKIKADLLNTLTSLETAYDLAKATGKATTISAARAPDVQAADLLSWVAARETIVNGLYRDAFSDPEKARLFASLVRETIRAGK